jgi:hypothetical protein
LTRSSVAVAVALGLAIGFPAATQAQSEADPLTVVRHLEKVGTDFQAELALYTEDLLFIGGPCSDQPGGLCRGRAEYAEVAAPRAGDPMVDVTLVGTPQVSGNVVTARVEERFSGEIPFFEQMGIKRLVEHLAAIVEDGKISVVYLKPDLTDTQTAVAFGAVEGPVANDGQTLSTQPPDTQAQFIAAYGERAAEVWVQQHNAALARARSH